MLSGAGIEYEPEIKGVYVSVYELLGDGFRRLDYSGVNAWGDKQPGYPVGTVIVLSLPVQGGVGSEIIVVGCSYYRDVHFFLNSTYS